MAKKKTTAPDDITAPVWGVIGRWLADRVSEMEADAASIAREQGRDLMPALRGLAAHLTAGGRMVPGAIGATDIVTMLRNRAGMASGPAAGPLRDAAAEIERMVARLDSRKPDASPR